VNDQLTLLGCFDHAWRKYVDALKATNKTGSAKGDTILCKAAIGLGKINALYRLERTIKDLPPHEKYQYRQKVAVPLLDELNAWLQKNISRVVKGGLTYNAMYYTLNQWQKLIGYCKDGRFNISNAGAENAIRPFAVGRRRWLFSDTPSQRGSLQSCSDG
jgi:hypothetical protein